MKWVYWIGGSAILLVALIAIVGWFLPVGHEASRSAEFEQAPDTVYALVAEVRGYPTWWKDISKVEVLSEQAGLPTFREHLSDGPIVMTVVEATAPSRFVTKIDDASQPFGGTWTFEMAPVSPSRTKLTITERGEIYNPIFRALARFVFGYTGTMERFLAAAEQQFNVQQTRTEL